MREPEPGFSVVVPTHSFGREALFRRCLDAVLASDPAAEEVLVVVDRDRALFDHLRTTTAGRARVLLSDGNGVAEARNLGLGSCTRGLVAFVDDDVAADPAWLGAMGRTFAERPEVVALGARIVPDYGPGARPVPDELLWLVGCTYAGHRTDRGPMMRPIGSAMAFRRSALQAVGGFPAAFGPAGEARRSSNEELAVSEGLRGRFGQECVWFEPDAVAHHFVPADRTGLRYLLLRSFVEGTSKADIRDLFGRPSMGHDRRYLTGTVVPRLTTLPRSGRAAADAGRLATSVAVTAGAYALRRLSRLGPSARRR